MSNIDLNIGSEAEADIADILQYTLETWGEVQADVCWSVLWDAFQRLRQFPEIGHPIEGHPSNIRSITFGITPSSTGTSQSGSSSCEL